MAARRNARGQFVKGGGGSHTRTVRGPAKTTSIIKVEAPRMASAAPRTRAVTHHRRRGGGVGGGMLSFASKHSRTSILIAAAALGFAHKQGWLAKLPVVGKAGPITSFALLGWGAEELAKMKLPPLVHDMITNALAISAFNLGLSGGQTIVGDDVVGNELDGAAYSMPGGAVFFD